MSAKNGEGLGTPITWMTSGGREVDVGGRGPRSNNLDFIIERSNDGQESWCSQDWQYLTSPVRNLLYCLLHSSWLMGNAPPYIHLAFTRRHSRDRCSQAFPIFRTHPLPCIILNENRRKKKRGRPGNEATNFLYRVKIYSNEQPL